MTELHAHRWSSPPLPICLKYLSVLGLSWPDRISADALTTVRCLVGYLRLWSRCGWLVSVILVAVNSRDSKGIAMAVSSVSLGMSLALGGVGSPYVVDIRDSRVW